METGGHYLLGHDCCPENVLVQHFVLSCRAEQDPGLVWRADPRVEQRSETRGNIETSSGLCVRLKRPSRATQHPAAPCHPPSPGLCSVHQHPAAKQPEAARQWPQPPPRRPISEKTISEVPFISRGAAEPLVRGPRP